MSSKVKTIVFIVAAIILGGVAYFALSSNTDESGESNNNGGQSQSDFSPVSTEGLAFEATFTTTSEGQTVTANVRYDGEKYWHYSTNQEGQEVEMIVGEDVYYAKANGIWYKYPVSTTGQSGFDQSAYEYDEADITALRQGASYEGQASCPAGTCDVWLTKDEHGNESRVYLSTSNRYISKVEITSGSSSSVIEYSYKKVIIELPENAQQLPSFPQ